MVYRVVLIFPDTERPAGFVEYLEVPGEVNCREHIFVGYMAEEQIKTARESFAAYV
jgi:hypothetical protein